MNNTQIAGMLTADTVIDWLLSSVRERKINVDQEGISIEGKPNLVTEMEGVVPLGDYKLYYAHTTIMKRWKRDRPVEYDRDLVDRWEMKHCPEYNLNSLKAYVPRTILVKSKEPDIELELRGWSKQVHVSSGPRWSGIKPYWVLDAVYEYVYTLRLRHGTFEAKYDLTDAQVARWRELGDEITKIRKDARELKEQNTLEYHATGLLKKMDLK